MASETDMSDGELPDNADLGEGAETYEGDDDAPEDEDDEAGNDLVDDAELGANQILDEDEGDEETGAPTPAEVEDDDDLDDGEDDVIDPEGDAGNFASDYSGVEV